jgi:predicted metal-binding protein
LSETSAVPSREVQVEVVACETCGGAAAVDASGRTRGERLCSLLEAARARDGGQPLVRVSRTRCLWACTQSCAVHLRSSDGRARVSYVLGGLEPSEEFADALLEYAKLYAGTSDGAVPLKQRPAALKGHFVCRIPAAPAAAPTPHEPAQPEDASSGDDAKPRV